MCSERPGRRDDSGLRKSCWPAGGIVRHFEPGRRGSSEISTWEMNRRGKGVDENDRVYFLSLTFYTTTMTTTALPYPHGEQQGPGQYLHGHCTHTVVAHLAHGHCASARPIAHLHGWVPRSSLSICSPTLAIAVNILGESVTQLTQSPERGRFRWTISDREFRRQPNKEKRDRHSVGQQSPGLFPGEIVKPDVMTILEIPALFSAVIYGDSEVERGSGSHLILDDDNRPTS